MSIPIRHSTWHVIELYKGKGKKKDEEIPHAVPRVLVAGETSDIRRIAKSKVYLSRMHDGLQKVTGRNIKPEKIIVKRIELSKQTFGNGVGNLG